MATRPHVIAQQQGANVRHPCDKDWSNPRCTLGVVPTGLSVQGTASPAIEALGYDASSACGGLKVGPDSTT